MADLEEKLNETVTQLTDTKDSTEEYDPQDIEKNKIMAILAYLGFLVIIPLFCAGESRFARFHVNQGLVLLITDIILGMIFALVGWLPLIGWLIKIVRWLASVIFFVFMVIGILNAYRGKAKDLPFIGGIRLLR